MQERREALEASRMVGADTVERAETLGPGREAGDQVDLPGAHPGAFLSQPEPLLTPSELLFLRLAGRDVARDPKRAEQRAITGAIRTFRRQEHMGGVAKGHSLLEGLDGATLEHQPVGFAQRVCRLLGEHLVERAPDQLFSRQADHLRGFRVQREEATVEILDEDIVAGPFDHRFKHPECLVGLLHSRPAGKGARQNARDCLEERDIVFGEISRPYVCAPRTPYRPSFEPIVKLRPLTIPCATICGETSNRVSSLASRMITGALETNV